MPSAKVMDPLPSFSFSLHIDLPRLEILADPAFSVRIAVKILSDQHDAAVMVGHHFIGVNFFGREFSVRGRDFEEIAADAIARTHIDAVVAVDRRGNDRRFAFSRRPPEQAAVFRGDARDALAR